MDESACFVRSFSNPSDASCGAYQGNPILALRESVSFGRFMSEPLAWEKWSSFTHNRHLEEANNFSKPGSVAQKKAYFEAHYKRIEAKKAALLEEANAVTNASETNIAEEMHSKPFVGLKSADSNSHTAIDIPQDIEVSYSTDANGCDPDLVSHSLDDTMVEETKPVTHESVIEKNYDQEEISEQCESVETYSKLMAYNEKNTLVKEETIQERLASTSNREPTVLSSESSAYTRESRLLSSSNLAAPVPQRKEDNGITYCKKSARKLVERMRSTPGAIYMSVNFAACAAETTKSSPRLKKSGNSRVHAASMKMYRDSLTTLQTSQAFMNEVSKHSSITPLSERKSHLESSGSCERKSHSPFRFRRGERVSKLKEFFEKLEEKIRREAGKVRLQPKAKEEAERDLKKQRQSIVSKPKPVADSYGGTSYAINHTNEGGEAMPVQLTKPQSPKPGRKPNPITVEDTSSQPPSKPSNRTDGSKHVTEKINSFARRYITSGPKKNAQENVSPNIQL